MKRKVSKLKKKGVDAKRLIGPDLTFDYEEVASATGPQYVRYMNRDGIAVLPYEELKRNVSGLYLPKEESVWMMAV